MHNAAFRTIGVDAVYVALRCKADDVPGLLAGVARAGGGGNVTVPHKEVAARHVERRTAIVERTGACNTFWLQDGEVWGDNTDIVGLMAAIEELLGGPPVGRQVLLLGAGGSAHSALCAVLDGGVAEVSVFNRTPHRAQAMIARCAPGDQRVKLHQKPPSDGERWDLVVNATSLGLRAGDPHPFDIRAKAAGAVLDLVYAPGGTPWVRAARSLGIPAQDGTGVLVAQGAAAFERWWGRSAPVEAMRKAALGAP